MVVDYIEGLVEDVDEDVDDIVEMTRGMLQDGPSSSDNKSLNEFMDRLLAYLESQSSKRVRKAATATRLASSVQMRSQQMSATIAMSGKVDLDSVNKGQASRVDLNKLAKAEAKLKAKMEKRSRRNLYESSKLIDKLQQQESYEEMFMKVNPLDLSGAAKGKSKDIHLPNIDVSFASNRILQGATLTMAHGRRYGLIGRNGVGKSTLLRNIALREVAIPTHISVLYVEQEIVGDDTTALESVLKADVWRHKLLSDEIEVNAKLETMEKTPLPDEAPEGEKLDFEREKDELAARLGEIQRQLIDMEAETGPARAALLLAGLGFSEEDQKKPTRAFSGGWRMRLALARALFVKPDLLMLDEPSNMLDLNAIAWLEDYLQSWPGTILVVSHDRSFLDAVATDIVHQHSQRLDYYKGNFTNFYATKMERAVQQKKEYEAQVAYRQHLQAYIDRWRYNANRAPQAQSRIKILEKLPELEPPEEEDSAEKFKFPDPDKISPPLLQLNEVSFGYSPDKMILKDVNIDIGLDSRMALIGPNGAGKSTLIKVGLDCYVLTPAPYRQPPTNQGHCDYQLAPAVCILLPAPCGPARPGHDVRRVPRVQVPRQDRAGVPLAPGPIRYHWPDVSAAHRDPVWWSEVSCRFRCACIHQPPHPAVGRADQPPRHGGSGRSGRCAVQFQGWCHHRQPRQHVHREDQFAALGVCERLSVQVHGRRQLVQGEQGGGSC